MPEGMNRREFLKNSAVLPMTALTGLTLLNKKVYAQKNIQRVGESRFKTSICAYSFRDYFRDGKKDLDYFLEYAAKLGFDGVELTFYYFQNYPEKSSDEYLYHIKRKAFLLGLDINGTAVGNNFCTPDESKRAAEMQRVKTWIVCASKLGAPEIRVFGGSNIPKGFTEADVDIWVSSALKECCEYAGKYGVILALENHGGFPNTAEQVLRMLKMVDSPWLAANLDVAGFTRSKDPYEEIAMVAPYAITCHVKVKINRTLETDMNRVVSILKNANYTGYLPIEYEEKEDPEIGIPIFLDKIKKAIG